VAVHRNPAPRHSAQPSYRYMLFHFSLHKSKSRKDFSSCGSSVLLFVGSAGVTVQPQAGCIRVIAAVVGIIAGTVKRTQNSGGSCSHEEISPKHHVTHAKRSFFPCQGCTPKA
jgi:hypothetical protein